MFWAEFILLFLLFIGFDFSLRPKFSGCLVLRILDSAFCFVLFVFVFDQWICFLYCVFNAWDFPFHLLHSVGDAGFWCGPVVWCVPVQLPRFPISRIPSICFFFIASISIFRSWTVFSTSLFVFRLFFLGYLLGMY